MLDFETLSSTAVPIEKRFEIKGFDPKNANPLDLIEARRPVGCAARAFVLAVVLGQYIEDKYKVMFTYHRAHKQVSTDGKLAEFEAKKETPRMDIGHARVEIHGEDIKPYMVDPSYTKDFTAQYTWVNSNPDIVRPIGPIFEDPVEGLRDYYIGHDRLKPFDLSDIDRAREILVNHNFSTQLRQAA